MRICRGEQRGGAPSGLQVAVLYRSRWHGVICDEDTCRLVGQPLESGPPLDPPWTPSETTTPCPLRRGHTQPVGAHLWALWTAPCSTAEP
eukprot:9485534-Pyramimonas_sp.AAC.1